MRLTLRTLTSCSEIWEAFISVKHWSLSSLTWAETELVVFIPPRSALAQHMQRLESGVEDELELCESLFAFPYFFAFPF